MAVGGFGLLENGRQPNDSNLCKPKPNPALLPLVVGPSLSCRLVLSWQRLCRERLMVMLSAQQTLQRLPLHLSRMVSHSTTSLNHPSHGLTPVLEPLLASLNACGRSTGLGISAHILQSNSPHAEQTDPSSVFAAFPFPRRAVVRAVGLPGIVAKSFVLLGQQSAAGSSDSSGLLCGESTRTYMSAVPPHRLLPASLSVFPQTKPAPTACPGSRRPARAARSAVAGVADQDARSSEKAAALVT